jgi:hypothetical protein
MSPFPGVRGNEKRGAAGTVSLSSYVIVGLLSSTLLKSEGVVIAVRLETRKIRDLQRGLYLKAKRDNSNALK